MILIFNFLSKCLILKTSHAQVSERYSISHHFLNSKINLFAILFRKAKTEEVHLNGYRYAIKSVMGDNIDFKRVGVALLVDKYLSFAKSSDLYICNF